MIREEMDLREEAKNQIRLAENIGPQQSMRKKVLNKFFQYLTTKIFRKTNKKYSFLIPTTYDVKNNTLMIEELVLGRPVNENDKDAMIAVAKELIRQIFVDGFYHADPHTGNIFIDEEKNTVYFIDIGSSAQLSFKNRYYLYELIKSLQESQTESLVKVLGKVTGENLSNFNSKFQKITDSKENVILKLIKTFQVLENLDIVLDKEFMSVFRCLAQAEEIFKYAMDVQGSTAGLEDAEKGEPIVQGKKEVASLQSRQASTLESFSNVDIATDIVRTVVGIPVDVVKEILGVDDEELLEIVNKGDFERMFKGISEGLGSNGYGQFADKRQVIPFIIYSDPGKTEKSYQMAVNNAQNGLKDGRVVLFAPQMDDGLKLAENAKIQYAGENNIAVVPDAYTDSNPEEKEYPDVMFRTALARHIAFCMNESDDVDTTSAISSINDMLRQTGNDPIEKISELLDISNTLRIRAIDYTEITEWQESQKAIATSL